MSAYPYALTREEISMNPIVKQHRDLCEKLSPIKPGEKVRVYYPAFGQLEMLVEDVDLAFTRGNVSEYRPSDYVPENVELRLVLEPKIDGTGTLRTRARPADVDRVSRTGFQPDHRRFKITRRDWGPNQGYQYKLDVLEKFVDVDADLGMFLEYAEAGDERAVGDLIIWRII